MRTTQLQPKLVPALLVKDMRATLTFYRRLGFEPKSCYPNEVDATWAEVAREGVALQFHTEPPCGTPPQPILSGTLYFYPESVRALAEELREKVSFVWGPEVMDYGMLEFGVQDPNGYYLAFTEPA